MTSLGITCTPHEAYLAVVKGGAVVDGFPERLRPSHGIEFGERLLEFVGEVRRVLGRIAPARVGLLLPESRQRGMSYPRIMPRVALETLVRVAAAEEQIPLDLVARATVRSRLGLPRRGSLDSHLPAAGGSPVGRYWNDGRGLAALAALALDAG